MIELQQQASSVEACKKRRKDPPRHTNILAEQMSEVVLGLQIAISILIGRGTGTLSG